MKHVKRLYFGAIFISKHNIPYYIFILFRKLKLITVMNTTPVPNDLIGGSKGLVFSIKGKKSIVKFLEFITRD